jgi:hypothetical protein
METYISVDVEASGPVPGEYSMLSIGACVVGATDKTFYVELKPLTSKYDPTALAVAGFDLKTQMRKGMEPARAMQQFDAWLASVSAFDSPPIFCGYPLAFDWMFVAYYFHRFLGRNPFGYSGFDLKSFYMGITNSSWAEASEFSPKNRFDIEQDLRPQAQLMSKLLEYANERPGHSR